MHELRVWLAVAFLAAACGKGVSADRPDGRQDGGTLADGGPSDGGEGDLGSIGPLGETTWKPLLDASLSHFYRWMPSRGRNDDPEGVFRMEGDTLHVLGLPPTDEPKDFGYLATWADFNNYRARVQQKWGTETFAPRKDQPRDTGLLYHLRGQDQIWPQCIEFQVMEHNTGDLWMLSGTGVTARVDQGSEPTFDPLGTPESFRSGRVIKSSDPESLTDWNTIELIASERDSAQIVNGRWVNAASAIEADDNGDWGGLSHGRLALQAEGAETFFRSLEVRPLAYLPPPDDAVVLFDGSDLDAWRQRDGGTAGWKVTDSGAMEVVPFAGDLFTRETHGDVRLHLEFQVPATPTDQATEDRGNSGVYLQGRYEAQILDTFGRDAGLVDCGAIYGVRAPTVNEAFPPGIWQSFDIVFRAPTWDGTSKKTPARMTVVWNGTVVQEDVEVPGPTRLGDPEAPGPGPIRLQDHWNKVRYRNIWIQPLAPGGTDGGTDGGMDAGTGGAPDGGP